MTLPNACRQSRDSEVHLSDVEMPPRLMAVKFRKPAN
jgi:hypothetical protein